MIYTNHSPQHQSLWQRAQAIFPGGVHSPVRAFKNVHSDPIFVASAHGAKIIDVDGREYLDFCMSWGPLLLGHCDHDVLEAVQQALAKGWSYGACETESLALGEFLVEHLPFLEKLRFVNSGTEAVMSALRLAKAATQRHKILKFAGCYHGHVDAMLVAAGSGLAEQSCPDSAGISEAVARETLVAPLDDEAAVKEIFQKYGSDIAAVIIEPLPANYGLLVQRAEFLSFLRDITHSYQSLLIFDEVISGFRIGLTGMAGDTGITPDLVCYGKIIGGGFPVGAFGGSSDLMEFMAPSGPVYQAGTLSANPVAMRAGLATLTKIKNLNPYPRLNDLSCHLAEGLKCVFNKHDAPLEIVVKGSLFWITVQNNKTTPPRRVDELSDQQKTFYATLYPLLLKRGIYLAPSGYEVGFLSVAHSRHDIERFVECFDDALTEFDNNH